MIDISVQLGKDFKTNEFLELVDNTQAPWRHYLSGLPFKNAIEKDYNGDGLDVPKNLHVLESASYHSIPLTLLYGINLALFLQPLAKYGTPELKKTVLSDFLSERKAGGLMISEPKHGTDAMNMQTTFERVGDKIRIRGVKHWQGLTGQADFWLVAGRMIQNQKLDKKISFCVVPQELVEYELYETQGLSLIQYGKNYLDLEVPAANFLEESDSSANKLLDILNRSRMQFTGMAIGYMKKILLKTEIQASQRLIRGKSISSIPSVQTAMSILQVYYTITRACNYYSSKNSGVEFDLSTETIIANSTKVTVTDFMQKSSDSNIQLSGGNSFLAGHFGFEGLKDSRPFCIFEGPNDMLLNQIGRLAIIGMRRSKMTNLRDYILNVVFAKSHVDLPENMPSSCDYTIEFDKMNQTGYASCVGKLTSDLVNIHLLYNLQSRGFDQYLIDNAIIYLENKFKSELYNLQNNSPLLSYQSVKI